MGLPNDVWPKVQNCCSHIKCLVSYTMLETILNKHIASENIKNLWISHLKLLYLIEKLKFLVFLKINYTHRNFDFI